MVNERQNQNIKTMEQKKQHGGARPGSGRPTTNRNCVVSIRLSQEAFDKLNAITTRKTQFIEQLILNYQPAMASIEDNPTRTEAITVRYPKDVLDRAAKETDPDRRSRIFMEEAERQFCERLAPSFFKMEFDPSARSLFEPDPQE